MNDLIVLPFSAWLDLATYDRTFILLKRKELFPHNCHNWMTLHCPCLMVKRGLTILAPMSLSLKSMNSSKKKLNQRFWRFKNSVRKWFIPRGSEESWGPTADSPQLIHVYLWNIHRHPHWILADPHQINVSDVKSSSIKSIPVHSSWTLKNYMSSIAADGW